MKRFPRLYYAVFRAALQLALPRFLNFKVAFKAPIPPGPKIYVGNHPTVWDVFAPFVAFKHDVLHTLIEDRIWSLPVANLIMSITNQVKVYRGVRAVESLHVALDWLARGESLVIAPEGERTSVTERRAAARGVTWLALRARVPLVPLGIWVADHDLRVKKVRYDDHNETYSADSYFPRFRAKYNLVVGQPIHLDPYYDRKLSPGQKQELSDRILDSVYRLREEAGRIRP